MSCCSDRMFQIGALRHLYGIRLLQVRKGLCNEHVGYLLRLESVCINAINGLKC